MSIELFIHKVCPYAHRAYLAAAEKKLIGSALQLVEVSLPTPDWYNKEVNPRETVPALRLADKTTVPESLIVVDFLEDAFPEAPKLWPTDAKERADIRVFIKETDTLIEGLYGLIFTREADKLEEKWANVKGDVEYIDKALGARGGPYFLGERFSAADVAILPFIDRFRHTLKAFRNIDLLAAAPNMQKLIAAAETRESFIQTSQPADYYVESYRKYAEGN